MIFETSEGASIAIEVRRRKGTKHLRLRLDQRNQIVVSAPRICSDRVVREFIDKSSAWIEERLANTPSSRSLSDWLDEHPFLSGSGDQFSVLIVHSERRRSHYSFQSEGADLLLEVSKGVDDFEAELQRLIRVFAKDVMHCRTSYLAKKHDLSFSKVGVRDQSSRWGSCSATRGISLNWRLVLLRPALQDYVILHELAHLTEMNHSPSFWALLDQYDSNRIVHETELDAVSLEVMRVGRS